MSDPQFSSLSAITGASAPASWRSTSLHWEDSGEELRLWLGGLVGSQLPITSTGGCLLLAFLLTVTRTVMMAMAVTRDRMLAPAMASMSSVDILPPVPGWIVLGAPAVLLALGTSTGGLLVPVVVMVVLVVVAALSALRSAANCLARGSHVRMWLMM